VIPINSKTHWLWRAVDADGLVLDALVQSREGRRAAEKLLRNLIRKQSRAPRVMVTDKPGSDGAARTGMGMTFEHRQHMGLNNMGLSNRAKNSHLPTRRRKRIMKRIMKRFKSARHLKRLVSIHDGVANLHTFPRHAMSSSDDRALRSEAMVAWREIAEPGVAAQCQGKAPRLRPAAVRQVDSTVPAQGRITVRSPILSAMTIEKTG
jgi:putative transposase